MSDTFTGSADTCWIKWSWITRESYCGRHGRDARWPCRVGASAIESKAS